jgi:hypothetical protein
LSDRRKTTGTRRSSWAIQSHFEVDVSALPQQGAKAT